MLLLKIYIIFFVLFFSYAQEEFFVQEEILSEPIFLNSKTTLENMLENLSLKSFYLVEPTHISWIVLKAEPDTLFSIKNHQKYLLEEQNCKTETLFLFQIKENQVSFYLEGTDKMKTLYLIFEEKDCFFYNFFIEISQGSLSILDFSFQNFSKHYLKIKSLKNLIQALVQDEIQKKISLFQWLRSSLEEEISSKMKEELNFSNKRIETQLEKLKIQQNEEIERLERKFETTLNLLNQRLDFEKQHYSDLNIKLSNLKLDMKTKNKNLSAEIEKLQNELNFGLQINKPLEKFLIATLVRSKTIKNFLCDGAINEESKLVFYEEECLLKIEPTPIELILNSELNFINYPIEMKIPKAVFEIDKISNLKSGNNYLNLYLKVSLSQSEKTKVSLTLVQEDDKKDDDEHIFIKLGKLFFEKLAQGSYSNFQLSSIDNSVVSFLFIPSASLLLKR